MPVTSLAVNAGQTQTYQSVVRALSTAGANVKSQIPPQRAEFGISQKAWGVPTGFDGEIGVQAAADGRSIVTIETKLSTGSVLLIAVMALVALFLVLAMWGPFGFTLWLIALGLQIWLSAVSMPNQVQKRIETAIHAAAGVPMALGPIAAAPAAVAPPPAWVQPAPTAQPAPSSPAPTPPANAGASGDVYTQIRKLAELKDAGVLTAEEFDAKKADLLKRI